MMAGTARLNAKQPLKQRESSPAAGATMKTRDVSNEGIRADVTSEVPVVKTWKSILPVVKMMTWKGEVPVVETMTWMSILPVVGTMTLKRKLLVAETTTRKEPAPSLKSLADVLGITASVSEQPATEAICGGNVVSLSMAN